MPGPQRHVGEEGEDAGAKRSLGRRDPEPELEAKAARIRTGDSTAGEALS